MSAIVFDLAAERSRRAAEALRCASRQVRHRDALTVAKALRAALVS